MHALLFALALAEVPYDGIDQDGDGADLIDVDRDGRPSVLAGGRDCDDRDPQVHPGARDRPGDRIDSDCGGSDRRDRRWGAARGRISERPRPL